MNIIGNINILKSNNYFREQNAHMLLKLWSSYCGYIRRQLRTKSSKFTKRRTSSNPLYFGLQVLIN